MKLYAWLPLLVSILTAGCASSHLTVSVDLYDEDPRLIAPMSLETAYRLIDDVNQLETAARDKTAQRQKLAGMAWEAYRATTERAGMRSQEVEQAYRKYVESVQDREKVLPEPFKKARDALEKYVAQYEVAYAAAKASFEKCERYRVASEEVRQSAALSATECRPVELTKRVERLGEEWTLRRLPPELRATENQARNAVSEAVSAYRTFAGPQVDEFTVPWAQLRARLNTILETAQGGGHRVEQAQIEDAIKVMNAKVTELAAAIKAIEPQRAQSPGPTRDRASSSSALLDSVARIAVELDAVRADLPESASARTALAGLAANATRFVELIDRLQDAGNPVWRIVTDPANEGHWNTEAVQTQFYAEGKSHVVMVRNDPMRFDVQEGTNNPAALIKGQLEITRAIANAAIGVLGASAGLPVRKPPAPGEAEVPATTSEASAAEDFARRKAVADEAARARERAMRGLSLELANIQSNLNAADDASLAAQRTRLAALLSAYKSIFKATKD